MRQVWTVYTTEQVTLDTFNVVSHTWDDSGPIGGTRKVARVAGSAQAALDIANDLQQTYDRTRRALVGE